MSEMREFCFRCQKVTPSRVEKHATYTEYLCAVCGWQVDVDYEDDWPDEEDEAVKSCDRCGANIYASDDDGSGLCDQCQFIRSL